MIAQHQTDYEKITKPYYGLWDGTGTGKTRTALYTLRAYANNGDLLVIAPKKSVQKCQWVKEAVTIGIRPPDVISKETFRRDAHKLKRYGAIIVDEAHYVFGVEPQTHRVNKAFVPNTSKLFHNLHEYLRRVRPDRVILATATPNKTAMSVWAAAKLLGIEIDYFEFRKRFYVPIDMGFWNPVYMPIRTDEAKERLAEITKALGRVLRIDDIKDVPPQIYITKEFDLTKAQKDMIKTFGNRFTGDATIRAKTHQVENGVLYEDVYDPRTSKITKTATRIDNEKVDYIVERSYEFDKMLIFATYTEQVDMIAEALRKLDKNVFIVDSRTKDIKEVERQVESMKSVYVVAQSSMSSEWEFKSCPVTIFASLTNRSIDYIQGQGRIQRYDNVKKNTYIHLVTDYPKSVDSRWFKTIMSGRDFNEALYDKKRI
jgi:superfamily II DNA or RNA helicase